MAEDPVIVSLCCNYGGNGMATGRVQRIEADGVTAEFDAFEPEDSPALPKCSILTNPLTLFIGHVRIPISGHQNWYGNWCWDAVWMARKDARRLLAYLIGKRGWDVTEYPVETDLLPLLDSKSK